MDFDAIVLAGGRGTRMGGLDKMAAPIEGVALLDRTLAGVAGARTVVVVGPARKVKVDVRWAREEPPGGGPVAAIAAGLARLEPPDSTPVVVMAGDLPFGGQAVPGLLEALPGHDVSLLVDGDGRDQFLLAAYRRASLEAAIASAAEAGMEGMAAWRLLDGLSCARVAAGGPEALDCDTEEHLDRARHFVSEVEDGS